MGRAFQRLGTTEQQALSPIRSLVLKGWRRLACPEQSWHDEERGCDELVEICCWSAMEALMGQV